MLDFSPTCPLLHERGLGLEAPLVARVGQVEGSRPHLSGKAAVALSLEEENHGPLAAALQQALKVSAQQVSNRAWPG